VTARRYGVGVSEYDKRIAPPSPGVQLPWRRQAGFLGVIFAVAAAVLAVGLGLAPQVSAYTGLGPDVLTGLIAFVLLLAAACVLFGVALSREAPARGDSGAAPSTSSQHGSPPDGAFPDGSFPDGSPPYSAAAPNPAAPGSVPPAPPGPTADGTAFAVPASGSRSAAAPAGTVLTLVGALLGTLGLGLATIAVALAVLMPGPTAAIEVQFTDLYGRVQLEYCPSLPGSFAGTASHDDLVGSSTILPVKVTAEVCGNPEYTDGVWIYLNRDAITVADRP
jgi:hypothetical protein